MRFKEKADYDVVGLGVSTLDMFTIVERFPAGREVQRALGMTRDGGGPVATALAALCRLGGRAAMLDRIGDDETGQEILQDFGSYGVDTRFIEQIPGAISAAATILVEARSGNRAIFYQPASSGEFDEVNRFRGVIACAKILHINGRHRKALPQAIAIAKAAGAKVSFDGGADRYDEQMRVLAAKADICVVARDFAEKYTKSGDPIQAARQLLADGPEIVGVTCGAGGSYIGSRDVPVFHQPAFAVEKALDTTGCGDSYHGAFLYALSRGKPLRDAAVLASAVAAMNTRRFGGRRGLPDAAAACDFLRQRRAADERG